MAFFRLEELLHAMRKDADVPPTRLKGKKYMKAGLVIIDEVGFETFTREEANLFFRLVSYRYQRGSLCITSNKAIKDWPEMLAGDEVITTAILDRLLHSCHVLNIRGRSYRLRDLEDEPEWAVVSRGEVGDPRIAIRRALGQIVTAPGGAVRERERSAAGEGPMRTRCRGRTCSVVLLSSETALEEPFAVAEGG